jgi:hypothetical protein
MTSDYFFAFMKARQVTSGAKLPFTGMSALGIRTGHATLADEVAYARFPIGTTFLSLRGTRDTTAALARSSKAVAMYFA